MYSTIVSIFISIYILRNHVVQICMFHLALINPQLLLNPQLLHNLACYRDPEGPTYDFLRVTVTRGPLPRLACVLP
jgi:hypothetical protein